MSQETKIDETKFKSYTKKPIAVQAYQTEEDTYIKTLLGITKVVKGDWIIRRVKGELCYYCNPEVFDLIFEETNNTINIYHDFIQWDKLINRINKISRRLIEIEEEYETKSEQLLSEARTIKDNDGKDIIKEKYGGNNDKTRKKYVEETLKELTDEKQELKLQKDEDNRRISFLKRLITMKIELLRYDGETSL